MGQGIQFQGIQWCRRRSRYSDPLTLSTIFDKGMSSIILVNMTIFSDILGVFYINTGKADTQVNRVSGKNSDASTKTDGGGGGQGGWVRIKVV